jgi:hypothetical protein
MAWISNMSIVLAMNSNTTLLTRMRKVKSISLIYIDSYYKISSVL